MISLLLPAARSASSFNLSSHQKKPAYKRFKIMWSDSRIWARESMNWREQTKPTIANISRSKSNKSWLCGRHLPVWVKCDSRWVGGIPALQGPQPQTDELAENWSTRMILLTRMGGEMTSDYVTAPGGTGMSPAKIGNCSSKLICEDNKRYELWLIENRLWQRVVPTNVIDHYDMCWCKRLIWCFSFDLLISEHSRRIAAIGEYCWY